MSDRRIAALERRIAQLEATLKQRIANVVQVSSVALTDASGKGEGVDGRPASESSQRSVRRIQHAGFRSRPPKAATAVLLSVEGSSTKVVVVAEDDGQSITLDDGETKVYAPAKPTAYLWIDKDGGIKATNASGASVQISKDGAVDVGSAAAQQITITAGAGASIVLKGNAAGGTLNVARATQDTAGPYPIVGGNAFVKA